MSYKAICKYINNFSRNTVYYSIALKEDYIMHENILSQIISLLCVENNFRQHLKFYVDIHVVFFLLLFRTYTVDFRYLDFAYLE